MLFIGKSRLDVLRLLGRRIPQHEVCNSPPFISRNVHQGFEAEGPMFINFDRATNVWLRRINHTYPLSRESFITFPGPKMRWLTSTPYRPLPKYILRDPRDDKKASQRQMLAISEESVSSACLDRLKRRRPSCWVTLLNIVILAATVGFFMTWASDNYGKNAVLKKSSNYCIKSIRFHLRETHSFQPLFSISSQSQL
jgi:hypothetical protein